MDQFANPTKRGVMLWVETDGTVYWATAENVITTQGEGGDRNDNKYIDNSKTYRLVVKTNSVGEVEFIGNYPDVTKPGKRRSKCGPGSGWFVSCKSATASRRSTSTRTTGSTLRILVIARAASSPRRRASSAIARQRRTDQIATMRQRMPRESTEPEIGSHGPS